MIGAATVLLIAALIFGAAATDQLAKREYLTPEHDRVDRLLRGILGVCAIAAGFLAGLLL